MINQIFWSILSKVVYIAENGMLTQFIQKLYFTYFPRNAHSRSQWNRKLSLTSFAKLITYKGKPSFHCVYLYFGSWFCSFLQQCKPNNTNMILVWAKEHPVILTALNKLIPSSTVISHQVRSALVILGLLLGLLFLCYNWKVFSGRKKKQQKNPASCQIKCNSQLWQVKSSRQHKLYFWEQMRLCLIRKALK